MKIPFHKPALGTEEIDEVVETLRSGWLTTGPKTKRFEEEFAAKFGFRHAVALNSATAALHLALEAIGLRPGEGVLVPTMTFAATAEVVRYFEARPILVDCNEDDLNISVADAERKASESSARGIRLRAVIPVHYGGQIGDVGGVVELAKRHGLQIIEDAAHACPAFYRPDDRSEWRNVGAESKVACFSFYANKCITTGEGGMACTNDDAVAERMRIMSLHGISQNAWRRFTSSGSWRYEILAPGFKYNLTDIASAIGIHQLRKADAMLAHRKRVADLYNQLFRGSPQIMTPVEKPDRIHAWHLYAIRLGRECVVDRDEAMAALSLAGIRASVHWIPLHLHPYYRETYSFVRDDFPVASAAGDRLISLPIYPAMTEQEVTYVATTVIRILAGHGR